jgi:DNA-binding transcriptional regulator YiaG
MWVEKQPTGGNANPVPPEAASSALNRGQTSRKLRGRLSIRQVPEIGVAAGLISKWECGDKQPSQMALKLLALVKAKGLEIVA